MNSLLTIGIILTCGFLLGEVASFLRLPKITGYILAGICLNPQFFKLIPEEFAEHTDIVTNISLAFITFSIGGTLLYSRIKLLGKTILWISIFEAEAAFIAVAGGFIAVLYLIGGNSQIPRTEMFIPLSILLASLASPTDPSATLAVAHEYKAKGPVSSTIMGVAAFDDVLGIINYSIGIVVAKIIFLHHGFSINSCIVHPLLGILGGIAVGIILGLILNPFTDLFDGKSEGTLIVIIFALLCLCYGTAVLLRFDELLATMSMGCTVVNFHPNAAKVFKLLERYTEELIFVFFLRSVECI